FKRKEAIPGTNIEHRLAREVVWDLQEPKPSTESPLGVQGSRAKPAPKIDWRVKQPPCFELVDPREEIGCHASPLPAPNSRNFPGACRPPNGRPAILVHKEQRASHTPQLYAARRRARWRLVDAGLL